MISYEKALNTLCKVSTIQTMTLPLQKSCGYTLADTIKSKVQIPPFANSAMDGFAVSAKTIANATQSSPIALPIVGKTVAGDPPSSGTHGVWEIMTGAPMPSGYDAVVKIEDVLVDGSMVVFSSPTTTGDNVRLAGEDFSSGDTLAVPGDEVSPYHIMALATINQKKVSVYRKPDITIFSTGKELIEDVNIALKDGQIRNSNGPYLMTALNQMGYRPNYGGTIADEQEVFEERLKKALTQADIIISTGAVSAGKHDFIPNSLSKLGAKILFHKVSIRPGKPILYAQFSDGTHYFGLPGNPISAAVGLRFFVTPLLNALQGMQQEKPITTTLLTPSPKKKGFRFFRKAYSTVDSHGQLKTHILDGQESFKINPMLKANSWAVLLEDADGTDLHTPVIIYPLLANQWVLEVGQ